jgi:exopolysaccharide production protein ExoZ
MVALSMLPLKKPAYLSIQAGRGMASVLVVAFHASGYIKDPRYWNSLAVFRYLKGGGLGVEYFFVLSGAVIFLAHGKDIGRPSILATYCRKRFMRIYPIYWVVLALVVSEYILRPGLGAAYQTNPFVIISGFLLIHIESMQVNLPVAWTLFHEILFYSLFAVLIYRRKFGLLLLGSWCAMSVVTMTYPMRPSLDEYLFAPIHLLFTLGIGVGWMLSHHKLPFARVAVTSGILMFMGAYIFASPGDSVAHLSPNDLAAGLGSALIILGLAAIEDEGGVTVPKFMLFLGNASYAVYLIHYPVMMFLAPWLYRTLRHMVMPLSVPTLLLTIAGVAAGCALHVYVERPLLRRLKPAVPLLEVENASL